MHQNASTNWNTPFAKLGDPRTGRPVDLADALQHSQTKWPKPPAPKIKAVWQPRPYDHVPLEAGQI